MYIFRGIEYGEKQTRRGRPSLDPRGVRYTPQNDDFGAAAECVALT